MRYLLDTHAFLWWVLDDERLSAAARKVIADGSNELFLSAASGWEIAIKAGLGRIVLPQHPSEFLVEQMRVNAIQPLPISMSHALSVMELPPHHRDPFDRMLVVQSKCEAMLLITCDEQILQYEVQTVW
jgi:PIN domain nuclease of toxin-antitoxin system